MPDFEILKFDTSLFERIHTIPYAQARLFEQMRRLSLVPFTLESVHFFKHRHAVKARRLWPLPFFAMQITLLLFGIQVEKAGWRRVDYCEAYWKFDIPGEVKKRLDALQGSYTTEYIDEFYTADSFAEHLHVRFLVLVHEQEEYYVALWDEKTKMVSPRSPHEIVSTRVKQTQRSLT